MMTDRKTWQAIALGSATVGGPRRRRSSSGKLVAIVRTVLTMAMPMVALTSAGLSYLLRKKKRSLTNNKADHPVEAPWIRYVILSP